jgi:hypothetical protein
VPIRGHSLMLFSREKHHERVMFYDLMQIAIAPAIVVIALAVGRYFSRHFQ